MNSRDNYNTREYNSRDSSSQQDSLAPQSSHSSLVGAQQQQPPMRHQRTDIFNNTTNQYHSYNQQNISNQPRVHQKRTRLIPLTPQGNLVIDVPVAERVRKMGKYTQNDEFIYLRSFMFNL
jgi:hypothetical protein